MVDKLDIENQRLNGVEDFADEDISNVCKIVNFNDYLIG